MVNIEDVTEAENVKETTTEDNGRGNSNDIPPSQERLLDAEAIEKAAAQIERPTARMHLEALAKKLRKESQALKMVEASKAKSSSNDAATSSTPAAISPESAASVSTPSATAVHSSPPSTAATPPPPPPGVLFTPVDRFSFDAGGYDSAFVTLYVPLNGVGSIPRENITCNFTTSSFDLVVRDLFNKSYRLFKDNLEKDISVDKSKIIVKADKIIVKLAKKKTDYGGYEFWTKLTDKKSRKGDGGLKDSDPQKSIMQLMKDMYDEGDDNMKKVIGEAMLKQRSGELDRDPIGGLGGSDDLDKF